MTALEVRAEIIKLARVLGRDADELRFLAAIPAADVRHLRETTQQHLFDADRATFRKLAAASKLLPTRITAVIAQKAFAPVFVARIAGEMPTDRAIDIAQRMDTGFLADVTLELDPRSVGPIIQGMPVPVVRDVALELVRRGEFITIGLFVGHLTTAAIEHVMAAIPDEEHLLRIALFIEARERIPTLVGMLSDLRLRRMLALATDESKDLWGPALALMAHVDPATQRTLGDLLAQESDETLTRLLRRSQAEDLWPAILPVVASMSPAAQARLLRIDALADPDVLRGIVESAQEHDLLDAVLPLWTTTAVDDVAAAVPTQLQDRLTDEVERAGLWPQLFDLAAAIPAADRRGLAGAVRRIAVRRPDLVEELAGLAEARGLGDLVTEARGAAAS
ncbi:MAG: hypothetical protein L0H84_23295 [Pseudonocardia sp.]|nr:hypothetical protein [Pseudonocardia sp.]